MAILLTINVTRNPNALLDVAIQILTEDGAFIQAEDNKQLISETAVAETSHFKISGLTDIGTPDAADYYPIVDTSAGETKRVTQSNLFTGFLTDVTSNVLSDLPEVSTSSPVDGQALTYNGSVWTNANIPAGFGSKDFVASGAIASGDRVGLTVSGTVKTITTGNANQTEYIGIATAAISDTATGTITVDGGTATNQTSLTPSSYYYVNTDGTLTTTDTGVLAGRALSATDLLVIT